MYVYSQNIRLWKRWMMPLFIIGMLYAYDPILYLTTHRAHPELVLLLYIYTPLPVILSIVLDPMKISKEDIKQRLGSSEKLYQLNRMFFLNPLLYLTLGLAYVFYHWSNFFEHYWYMRVVWMLAFYTLLLAAVLKRLKLEDLD